MYWYAKQHEVWNTSMDLALDENAHHSRIYAVADLGSVIEKIVARMRVLAYSDRDLFSIRLAVTEAVINGFRHGNCGDPSKFVQISFLVTPRETLVDVQDQGNGFDPACVPDPLVDENLDRPGGRGIFLMRVYTSWMCFNQQGNRVSLCRRRSGPPEARAR